MEFANVAFIIMGVCLCIFGFGAIRMQLKSRRQSKDHSDG